MKEEAAPKTINLELGTLRAILRRHRLWSDLQPDVKMLTAHDDVGKALTAVEEQSLRAQCGNSRSRALLPILTLAPNTGMRRGEILSLIWQQIDFLNQRLTVGRSKTEAGRGRVIPLNDHARTTLERWATNFPRRKPDHYVFVSERYGLAGNDEKPQVYSVDPTKPIKSLKDAWESAKRTAGVRRRLHDLRHTACTRMVERGVPLPVIGSLFGWSAATTVRMAHRYGHIGADAQEKAVRLWSRQRRPLARSRQESRTQ